MNKPPQYQSFFLDQVELYPNSGFRRFPMIVCVDHATSLYLLDVTFRHRDFCSLYIVRAGRGKHVINNTTYEVSRGDVYITGTRSTHRFTECEDLVFQTVHFVPSMLDADTVGALDEIAAASHLDEIYPLTPTKGATGRRLMHLTPERYDEVTLLYNRIHSEWSSGTLSGGVIARALLIQLLIDLARLLMDKRDEDTHSYRSEKRAPGSVASAISYIDEHFSEPIQISEIAASVNLSIDRFSKLFFRLMGRTPRDYLHYVRLERARSLLESSEISVGNVGALVGFPDASYFSRTFRKATQMTPLEYRQHKQQTR